MCLAFSRINEAHVQNMRCRRVDPDGNCLFRAASVALSGDFHFEEDESATELRSEVVTFMRKNRTTFECFMLDNFDRYLEKMQQNNIWGGEQELSAIARLKRRPVHVYESIGNEYVLFSQYPDGTAADRTAIRLLFNAKHYDALFE